MEETILVNWIRDHFDDFPFTDDVQVVTSWYRYRAALSFRSGSSLVDLGGGVSPLNAFLAQQGMNVAVVDLLQDYYTHSTVIGSIAPQIKMIESCGVRFVKADFTDCDLRSHFAGESVDTIVSYHTLEHLHHSPRRLLGSAYEILRPGGKVIIEVPNAANMLKRLKLLVGRTNYQPYRQYFESDRWVGHVREYTVGDLREMASHLNLSQWSLHGRNWYGTLYRKVRPRGLAAVLDRLLRVRPGLCGSLFLVGRK